MIWYNNIIIFTYRKKLREEQSLSIEWTFTIKYSLKDISNCENSPFGFLNKSSILHCENREYRDTNFKILYEDGV